MTPDSYYGRRVRLKRSGRTGVIVEWGDYTVSVRTDEGQRLKAFLWKNVEFIEEERHAED